jgi:hypothetical protein
MPSECLHINPFQFKDNSHNACKLDANTPEFKETGEYF